MNQIHKGLKSEKRDQLPSNESKKDDNEPKDPIPKKKDKNISNNSAEETEKDSELKTSQPVKKDIHEEDWSLWTNEDKERILNIFSKVFLLNFPLYMAFKHSMQSKLDVSNYISYYYYYLFSNRTTEFMEYV